MPACASSWASSGSSTCSGSCRPTSARATTGACRAPSEIAHAHAFTSPLRRLAGDVLIPHTTAFGWIIFLLGLLTGLSLLLGLLTRIGATLGLLQAIAITLLVANAPGEWLYGYLMFILLSALLLLLPVSRRMSLDDALGRDP